MSKRSDSIPACVFGKRSMSPLSSGGFGVDEMVEILAEDLVRRKRAMLLRCSYRSYLKVDRGSAGARYSVQMRPAPARPHHSSGCSGYSRSSAEITVTCGSCRRRDCRLPTDLGTIAVDVKLSYYHFTNRKGKAGLVYSRWMSCDNHFNLR